MNCEDKSFIMIRPDGSRIINEIDLLINEQGFEICDVFHIPVWDKLYYQLHEDEFSIKDNIFADNVKLNIWMSKEIFGNNALILLLKHSKYSDLDSLVAKTFDLKFLIRDKHTETRDGKFVIAINDSLIGIPLEHFNNYGNLVVSNNGNLYNFSEKMTEKGIYVPAYFNYIHCPEKGTDEIKKEYKILKRERIITPDNRLSNKEYNNCKIMHSCYRNRSI